ncbi:MAG: aminodeoxychorismate synthase component I [Sphingobium sp.]
MTRSLGSVPFVLIDDARPHYARPQGEQPHGGGRPVMLYRDPAERIEARSIAQVRPALDRVRQAQQRGLHAAGFLSYEAGLALEERLGRLDTRLREDDPPLLWFGLFETAEPLSDAQMADLLGEGQARGVQAAPLIDRAAYERAFAAVRERIVAGDIYQANLTFPCHVAVGGDPLAFYRTVRPWAAAGHGALVFTGDHWLLSFSPELFFSLEGRDLTTRPMKGTALRDADPARDAAHARELASDPKQRAENLMIVDLLRNDLSRIAEPGSVAVPHLFTVESYPTVHQMVSTVTGRLAEGLRAVDALEALFPCGSITGAPKIRAMEIIHEVERSPRGPYTGSIGVIDAQGDALFNVAIRTICVKDGADIGVIGLGSGLVVDSVAANEWHECLDKGRFLSSPQAGGDDERG